MGEEQISRIARFLCVLIARHLFLAEAAEYAEKKSKEPTAKWRRRDENSSRLCVFARHFFCELCVPLFLCALRVSARHFFYELCVPLFLCALRVSARHFFYELCVPLFLCALRVSARHFFYELC